jgi:hypothetical protein
MIYRRPVSKTFYVVNSDKLEGCKNSSGSFNNFLGFVFFIDRRRAYAWKIKQNIRQSGTRRSTVLLLESPRRFFSAEPRATCLCLLEQFGLKVARQVQNYEFAATVSELYRFKNTRKNDC